MSPLFIFDADYPRALLVEEQDRGFPKGIVFLKNWHFEDPICWSRSPAASLAVERAMFPVPSELRVEVEVFNATEHHPKTLTVESLGNVPRRYVFTTSERRTIMVMTPEFGGSSQLGELVFHVDQLESPFQIGLAMDDRLLGVAVHAISVCESRPVLPLDLCGAQDLGSHLVSGWSTLETIGVWTDADVVEISLKRGDIGNAVGVDLAFGLMDRPETVPPLEIWVTCNDREIERLSLTSGDDHCLRVMFFEGAMLGEDQRIRIEMVNLVSPAELGMSTDGRRLGICLKRIDPVYLDTEDRILKEIFVS